MTDGQSEACLWNEPEHDPDYPFRREVEQQRLEAQEKDERESWIEKTRRRAKEIDADVMKRHGVQE